MNYFASITSQGQLTIPMPLRKRMGLTKLPVKVLVSETPHGWHVRPAKDFLSYYGILKNNPVVKANKGKPLQQIIDEENAAIQKAMANNVARSMGLPPLK